MCLLALISPNPHKKWKGVYFLQCKQNLISAPVIFLIQWLTGVEPLPIICFRRRVGAQTEECPVEVVQSFYSKTMHITFSVSCSSVLGGSNRWDKKRTMQRSKNRSKSNESGKGVGLNLYMSLRAPTLLFTPAPKPSRLHFPQPEYISKEFWQLRFPHEGFNAGLVLSFKCVGSYLMLCLKGFSQTNISRLLSLGIIKQNQPSNSTFLTLGISVSLTSLSINTSLVLPSLSPRVPCCSTCITWARCPSPCLLSVTTACSFSTTRTRSESSSTKACVCLCPRTTPCSSTTPRSVRVHPNVYHLC